ncbi:hypothetical protein [Rickettsiales endosymbiont of Trichoplax sp. H2]|uniref:hypothetical protein n=1 Tax=Rickettsiales endosymbiont of Trichoplax sp. H2 TaxID=2021221 RepID=UPI0012B23E16|nr:hypothetical protein [Rickettsiales endosymbiont of Trichoplax sp. H2]MSO14292.1 hypothetical protein [Rickettsiales endosymbiont of Trichoplax sp. H2]
MTEQQESKTTIYDSISIVLSIEGLIIYFSDHSKNMAPYVYNILTSPPPDPDADLGPMQINMPGYYNQNLYMNNMGKKMAITGFFMIASKYLLYNYILNTEAPQQQEAIELSNNFCTLDTPFIQYDDMCAI